MKTLFLVLGLMLACKPTDVKIKHNEAGHTGTIEAPIEEPDPVGVMPAEDCQHIDIGDTPCNFRLSDQNGSTWDLYAHTGQVIVLDFSTMWCGPCQLAGHHTQPIQDDYVSDGVQFVTILLDGYTHGQEPTQDDISTWVRDHGITTAPILQGSRDKVLDSTGVGTEGYLLSGFPTYIYIGRDMKFIGGHVGFSEEYVREKIEEAI